jgi:hypothetical protein
MRFLKVILHDTESPIYLNAAYVFHVWKPLNAAYTEIGVNSITTDARGDFQRLVYRVKESAEDIVELLENIKER